MLKAFRFSVKGLQFRGLGLGFRPPSLHHNRDLGSWEPVGMHRHSRGPYKGFHTGHFAERRSHVGQSSPASWGLERGFKGRPGLEKTEDTV